MLTLREVQGIQLALDGSPVSKSPIWNMQIDQIIPAQLAAFRARLGLSGLKSEADTTIQYILGQVKHAAKMGGLGRIKMLDYVRPNDEVLMSSELERGFREMVRPMPAAILFGLEAKLQPDEIVTLTWQKAHELRCQRKLTPFAVRILDSQPINIASSYIFWRYRSAKVLPLFGLEQEVFDVFGKIWPELQAGYEGLILDDHQLAV